MIEHPGSSLSAWNVCAGRWLHTNMWLLAPRFVIVLSLVLAAMLLWGIYDVSQGAHDSFWLGSAFFGAFALHTGLIIIRPAHGRRWVVPSRSAFAVRLYSDEDLAAAAKNALFAGKPLVSGRHQSD